MIRVNALRVAASSAVNMMNLSLAEIESIASHEKLPPDIAEDVGASLRTILNRLEKADGSLTGLLKTWCLENGKTVVEGERAIGTLVRYDTERLDVPKVKAFLGKKLKDFTIPSEVIKFTHKPK